MAEAARSHAEPAFLRARVGARPWTVGADTPLPRLACARDGRRAAGALGRLVWVMDLASGDVTHWLETASFTLFGLCFSPDGAAVYAVGDRSCEAWDLATVARRTLLSRPNRLPFAALSADGRALAVDGLDLLAVIDVASGAVTTLRASPIDLPAATPRMAPVFSADGARLLTSDVSLRRWDLAAGASAVVAEGPCAHACRLDDGTFVVADALGRLTRYDAEATRPLATSGHLGKVHALLAEGPARRVYVETPARWDAWELSDFALEDLAPVASGRALLPSWTAVAAGGDVLCTAHEGTVRATRLSGGGQLGGYHPRGSCRELAFDDDATHVAAAFAALSDPCHAARWRVADGALVGEVEARGCSLRLAPDGAAALTQRAGVRSGAALTALDASLARRGLEADGLRDRAIALGRDGRHVAVEALAIEVLPDGPRAALPPKHKLSLRPVWDQRNDLVVAHDYKRVAAFDLRAMAPIEPLAFPRLFAIQCAGGGVWVLAEKTAQRWDLRARRKVRAVKLPLPEHEFPISLAVSGDERRLAVGLSAGSAIVLELDGAGRAVTFPATRAGIVYACALSRDGALLATGSAEPVVRVWDVDAALGAAPATRPSPSPPSTTRRRRGARAP